MPEEQRLKEDLEYAQRTREKEKGEMGFLQKYYHKGAFHQVSELCPDIRLTTYSCSGRRTAQPGLHCCYGECCGHEQSAIGDASSRLRKGVSFASGKKASLTFPAIENKVHAFGRSRYFSRRLGSGQANPTTGSGWPGGTRGLCSRLFQL